MRNFLALLLLDVIATAAQNVVARDVHILAVKIHDLEKLGVLVGSQEGRILQLLVGHRGQEACGNVADTGFLPVNVLLHKWRDLLGGGERVKIALETHVLVEVVQAERLEFLALALRRKSLDELALERA